MTKLVLSAQGIFWSGLRLCMIGTHVSRVWVSDCSMHPQETVHSLALAQGSHFTAEEVVVLSTQPPDPPVLLHVPCPPEAAP